MSTEGMMDVEVPVHGSVVVENGDVHEIDSEKTDFVLCTCRDGVHKEYDRTHNLGGIPHVVGVTTVKVAWTAHQPERTLRKQAPPHDLESLAVAIDDIGRMPK